MHRSRHIIWWPPSDLLLVQELLLLRMRGAKPVAVTPTHVEARQRCWVQVEAGKHHATQC